jgi:catechol 2,3-dioxygenase-like lactoylglutathione lyase family enzyme
MFFVALACVALATAACDSPAPTEEESTPVNPMNEYGMTASNVFLYYADVEAATEFYTKTLGLAVAADYGFAKILRVAPSSFITLVDEEMGMHSASDPKTVAIALITDQLDEWWDYLKDLDVEMRSTSYNPQEGRPHHGFVAIDPEGYLLEFERFNEHPENEMLIPVLNETETVYPAEGASDVPPGLGFKATVVWFYYKDMPAIQAFYEEVMGFDLIVDQGWTKIYRISPSGYMGLVDEQRGMHNFTEKKAVTMSFWTDRIDDWYAYVSTNDSFEMRSEKVEATDRYRAFVAYDPEGYYLEWNVFTEVPDNETLQRMLRGEE